MKPFRILVAGDVVGQPGRKACQAVVPRLRRDENLNFVIVNAENLAGGSGITDSTVRELFECGVDVLTSGDHVFRKKEGEALLEKDTRILRPANYPERCPGRGSTIIPAKDGVKVGVLNLLGRVFLKNVDCPFETGRRIIEEMRKTTPVILVDIHAEATSEKVALGWFLDGKVSAIYGTHTHVQTADERILPKGTGYITELGMCGPYHSVIGREIDDSLDLFLTQMPVHLEVATEDIRFSGAIFDINPETGKTIAVKRVHEKVED